MILACNSIEKSFNGTTILSDCSFHIEAKEKAAIVGINGAGKSTLLKIIMNQLQPDHGTVSIRKDASIGYLAQHQDLTSSNTIYSELLEVKQDIIALEQQIRTLEQEMKHLQEEELKKALSTYTRLNHAFEIKNGYSYQSEITGVLKGLGFVEEEFQKPVSTLSGGQKTRVFLGKLLLSKPDIILLDEPTNHLDMNSIAWLETYLSNYDGCVLVVAHDRYFLDKVVSKVIELDHTKAHTYLGNYSDYAKKAEQIRNSKLRQYYNQQQEIKHQEEVIAKLRSFNREKSIRRAESREKMLEKMEVLEKPADTSAAMRIHLTPKIMSGNDVLTVSHLSKAFRTPLFSDVNFQVKRNERIAIIGDNGSGKTTILKIINQLIPPDSGSVSLGANVHIGYYDQEQQVLHMEKTIFEEISDDYPSMTNTQIRNVLASFLFSNDDVFKRIADLSGGERGRVSLAKLMLSNANFLILDEPTNHLDITSKEILENALIHYSGTVLYVSHDRYFINRTATRILELTNQILIPYLGNYDYYLEKKEELTKNFLKLSDNSEKVSITADSSAKTDWKIQKEEQAKLRKQANLQKRLEQQISELEQEQTDLNKSLECPDISSDVAQLSQIYKRLEEVQKTLEEVYEEWEESLK